MAARTRPLAEEFRRRIREILAAIGDRLRPVPEPVPVPVRVRH